MCPLRYVSLMPFVPASIRLTAAALACGAEMGRPRCGSRCAGSLELRAFECVPLCDFPLGPHRKTAGCGLLAITFVHFPGGYGWVRPGECAVAVGAGGAPRVRA
ncbi:hypothetical protein SSP24_70610 [Streptomyces spinoverrucosus]|uniref:Secreted protein n=1 Tax=Streptomyces spinoverrucosus TaxID=284043 RepID=A0A4Y3VWL7_9ACTN|nr:hypothetical protein SSP24_70610 [Streptomyces spinoverrucosus]GHB61378.1 hypothetical protein GCM10010397_34610 [Streptomyces spinoverrucosus]